MKKRNLSIVLILTLLLGLGLGMVASARSSYGSEDDPLITLSYLEEVFKKEVLKEVEELVDDSDAGTSTAKGSFQLVTLSDGQVLRGKRGCEVVLRIGQAAAYGADEPVLVDTSAGTELAKGGALIKNHLYMITIEGNGLQAVGSAKVLVSGGYTVSD